MSAIRLGLGRSIHSVLCGPAVHYQRTKHIDNNTKFHFQRQLLLEGVIRLQHQATDVLFFSDILLDKAKRWERICTSNIDVLFLVVKIQLYLSRPSCKLPESQKLAVRRHTELIIEAENKSLNQSSDPVKAALVASVQA
jgi:hypothetical protein